MYKNLRNIRKVNCINYIDIDISLWGVKLDTITCYKNAGSRYWRDINTGHFTKGDTVEDLYDSYLAKINLDSEMPKA